MTASLSDLVPNRQANPARQFGDWGLGASFGTQNLYYVINGRPLSREDPSPPIPYYVIYGQPLSKFGGCQSKDIFKGLPVQKITLYVLL